MRSDRVYLHHMLDAVQRIECYVAVGYDSFMSATHWQDAVIRQLEILGEATKRLSDELRADHDEVAWRRVAGLRDVLIHDYMGVDLEAVWEVTQQHLPVRKDQLTLILDELGPDG
jgi:uncharacterized protein with HEPN domain